MVGKDYLILIASLLVGAQLQNQIELNNKLNQELSGVKESVNNVTEGFRIYKNRVYKYVSPIHKSEFEKITSPFGYRELLLPETGGTHTSFHEGIDIVGSYHCEIYPIYPNGKVLDKWYPPGKHNGHWYKGNPVFGGYVRIQQSDGYIAGYGHMSTIYVKEGDVLKNGIFYRNGKPLKSKGIIGRQGNTGLSTGEHLHLSIEKDGKFLNPILYVKLGVEK